MYLILPKYYDKYVLASELAVLFSEFSCKPFATIMNTTPAGTPTNQFASSGCFDASARRGKMGEVNIERSF